MKTHLEVAKSRLFNGESLHAVDIKLFPGSSRDSTAEQMAEQINKVIAQLEAGDYEVVDDAGE
jgi:hypothetical protein